MSRGSAQHFDFSKGFDVPLAGAVAQLVGRELRGRLSGRGGGTAHVLFEAGRLGPWPGFAVCALGGSYLTVFTK
jgi:hypothetical protein